MKILRYLIQLFIFLLFCSGCIQRKPPVPINLYSLQDHQLTGKTLENKSSISLGILPFQAASSIENRILYRLSPVEMGYYEYERWAEPPEEMVTRTFSEALGSSGLFSKVTFGRNYSPSSTQWLLTGIVERYEEDRSSFPPTAYLRVALEIYRTDGDILIWNKRLSSREPLKEDTRTHLALSMDKNLTHILEDAINEIAPEAASKSNPLLSVK